MGADKRDPKKPEATRTRPLQQGSSEGYLCPSCETQMDWLFSRHVCPNCHYTDVRTEGGIVPKRQDGD